MREISGGRILLKSRAAFGAIETGTPAMLTVMAGMTGCSTCAPPSRPFAVATSVGAVSREPLHETRSSLPRIWASAKDHCEVERTAICWLASQGHDGVSSTLALV